MRRSASLRRDHPCALCYAPWPSDQALLSAKLKCALGTDLIITNLYEWVDHSIRTLSERLTEQQ